MNREEFADHILDRLQAKPRDAETLIRRGYEPFTFVGGPHDGGSMMLSESFTRECHADVGKDFNEGKHEVACLCPTDGGDVVVHTYEIDWPRKRCLYGGIVGLRSRRVLPDRPGTAVVCHRIARKFVDNATFFGSSSS